MDAMLAEATASPLGGAPLPVEAMNLPNVCMGVAVFASLGLQRIGFKPLDEKEGDALGKGILRVMNAYNVNISDERVASVLDLGALGVAIMVPRIVDDMKARAARKASPTQTAANDRADENVAPAT